MSETREKLETLRRKICPGLTTEEFEALDEISLRINWHFESEEDLKLLEVLPNLECVQISDTDSYNSEAFQVLKRIPRLKRIRIDNDHISRELIQVLAEIPNLEHLIFINCGYSESDLEPLRGKSSLKYLYLGSDYNLVSEKILGVIKALPQLEMLILPRLMFDSMKFIRFVKENLPNIKAFDWKHETLTDEEREALKAFPHLYWLSLEREYHLDEAVCCDETEDLELASSLHELRVLHLSNYQSLQTLDWDLPELEELVIHNCRNLRFIDFSRMPKLENLELKGLCSYEDDVAFETTDNVELKDLDSLSSLVCAWFADVPCDESVIRALEMNNRLWALRLERGVPVTGKSLQIISEFPELRHLWLPNLNQVSQSDLAQLSPMRKLRSFRLLDAKDLSKLGSISALMPNLEYFSPVKIKVTDEIIEGIEQCKHLKILQFTDCEYLTEKGLRMIASFPEMCLLELPGIGTERLQFRNMPRLIELHLSCSQYLQEIELKNLPRLKTLVMNTMAVQKLTAVKLPRLNNLNLTQCPELKSLYMTKAPIHKFDVINSAMVDLDILEGMYELKSLRLSKEQLYQKDVLETLQCISTLRSLRINLDEVPRMYSEVDFLDPFFSLPCDGSEVQDEKLELKQLLPDCSIMFMKQIG